MNKVVGCLTVGLIAVWAAGLAYAGGTGVVTTGPLAVTASVGGNLSFSWELYDESGQQSFSWSAQPASSLNFGALEKSATGNNYYSPKWYALILYTTANSPYNIQQGYSSLSSGGNHLNNSFIVTPDYQAADMWDGKYAQGSKGNDIMASPSLVKNANILYAGNAGQGRILRFYYAIPQSAPAGTTISGFTPVTSSQPQGNYYGSVTVSIVAQ
ncbi:MAG: hypothetical protein V1662_05905 [Candidatus Omnitrophota bacterium]